MRLSTTAMLVALAAQGWSGQIERRGEAAWPTANHLRVRHVATAPAGVPLAADLTLPTGFNPDSVRVIAEGASRALASKTEWRNPSARISFISSGAPAYWIYFDEGDRGETERVAPPAMVGTGDRITYGRAGVRGRVAVGLHPRPAALDADGDGDLDLVMLNHQGYLSLYRRAGVGGVLRLLPPERIFVTPAGRFLNLAAGRAGASGRRKIEFADLDRDGDLDLITDSDEGPVWYENQGTQAKPVMQLRGTLVRAKLAGHNPTPNVVDWNGDGKLDLIIGAEDGFFYYFDGRYLE